MIHSGLYENKRVILMILLACVQIYIIYMYYISIILPIEEFKDKIIPFDKSKNDVPIINENSNTFPFKDDVKNEIERYFNRQMIMTSLNRIFSQEGKYYMSVSLLDVVSKKSILARIRMNFKFKIDGFDIINQNDSSNLKSANSVYKFAEYKM